MRAFTPPRGNSIRHWPLLAWGWGMLLVVLLSAAPTGGAPRSALIGSAFDPASMAVSLGPSRTLAKPGAKGADKLRHRAAPRALALAAPQAWPGLATVATLLTALPSAQRTWNDRAAAIGPTATGAAAAPHSARAPPAA